VVSTADSLRALIAQVLRFAGVGAFIMCLYLGVTAGLSELAGVPFQVAVAVGYFTGVAVHFVLHRIFVFASDDEYALSVGGQLLRFVVLVIGQYAVTAGSVALLPNVLGVDRLYVWLGTVAVVTPVAFVLLRTRLFHPSAAPEPVAHA